MRLTLHWPDLRAFAQLAVAGLALPLAGGSAHMPASAADERVLSIYNIHNGETLTVVYKKDGKYIPSALKKLDWIFRDWRRNEATRMDPKLYDIIWEIHTELGSRRPVHLISGYRSRKTNNMLRRTVGGQARNSRHILGKAADIHFPDVPVRRMRYSALVRERGGVGYYPTSAIPFIHVDTGRVRHWPRMGRYELALLFPNGKTRHVPRDGRPITKRDVIVARRKYASLAQKIASFHALRASPKAPVMVAALEETPGKLERMDRFSVPVPVLASLGTATPATTPTPARSFASPRPERTAPTAAASRVALRLAEGPVEARRGAPAAKPVPATRPNAIGELLASLGPDVVAAPPRPVRATRPDPAGTGFAREKGRTRGQGRQPSPFGRDQPQAGSDRRSPSARTRIARRPSDRPSEKSGEDIFLERAGWAMAPEYDSEHPNELIYRPFPIAPLLTAEASIDDPVLARLVHPDLARAREWIAADGEPLHVRFKPGLKYAELLWSYDFSQERASDAYAGPPGRRDAGGRKVRTTRR